MKIKEMTLFFLLWQCYGVASDKISAESVQKNFNQAIMQNKPEAAIEWFSVLHIMTLVDADYLDANQKQQWTMVYQKNKAKIEELGLSSRSIEWYKKNTTQNNVNWLRKKIKYNKCDMDWFTLLGYGGIQMPRSTKLQQQRLKRLRDISLPSW